MIKNLLVCGLLGLNSAFAAVPVEDPQGFLKQLDQIYSTVPFEAAFKCGDIAKIRTFNTHCIFGCGTDGCSVVCHSVNDVAVRTVSECSEEQISLIDADGTMNFVTRENYLAKSGNLLRSELANLDILLGMNGRITLEAMTPVSFTLLISEKAIDAFEVKGKYWADRGPGLEPYPIDFAFTVNKDQPAVGQILFLKVFNMKMYKVQDIQRP